MVSLSGARDICFFSDDKFRTYNTATTLSERYVHWVIVLRTYARQMHALSISHDHDPHRHHRHHHNPDQAFG